MSYSLNSLKGVIWGIIWGTTIGVIKGDTRIRLWLVWFGCLCFEYPADRFPAPWLLQGRRNLGSLGCVGWRV